MRKILLIPGIILVAAVLLISGSALGVSWHYAVDVVDYEHCHNPQNALGAPNDVYASLGVETPIYNLGWIILDLGEDYEMGALQTFWVFSNSSVTENYDV